MSYTETDNQGPSGTSEELLTKDAVEQITEQAAPVVSEESKEEVTIEKVTEPEAVPVQTIEEGEFKGAFAYSADAVETAALPTDSQFANPEQTPEPTPEQEPPTKIHPIELGLLLEKAAEKNPNLEIVVDRETQIVTLEGVRYQQTVEVPASPEATAHFEKQMAAYIAEKKRNSIAGLREELDALKAEVDELKSRIEDHNSRSGHKI